MVWRFSSASPKSISHISNLDARESHRDSVLVIIPAAFSVIAVVFARFFEGDWCQAENWKKIGMKNKKVTHLGGKSTL
jgi:hypothetical protein